MDRAAAYRKWQTLARMTTARGCTPPEAATAARLAKALAGRWGFGGSTRSYDLRRDFETRYRRAEGRAARRWAWEYRTCGKPTCHCYRGHAHGPYKYAKRREGGTVRSIYLGR